MRRTKIVCTLGPSSSDDETILGLVKAGMDVARLNFSHGTHDDHRRYLEAVHRAADESGNVVAVMADLQGPKIRTGPLKDGRPVQLQAGAPFCITTRDVPGTAECVSTTYEFLHRDVKTGDRLLLADGVLELSVSKVSGPDIHCIVVRGGELGEHKGINLPGVPVSAELPTEKDIEDLGFALDLGVDYVALSFVRSANDIADLKERIASAGHDTPVVAKIERPEAVENIDDILDITDAVMVARGDLGVEMELYEVPQLQKDIISKCSHRGVPVITATQMLESMISSVRPTRAEAADVANAIHDGTDALMLSGETAIGRFPTAATATMARIASKTDEDLECSSRRGPDAPHRNIYKEEEATFAHVIGHAASYCAENVNARCITCFTMSGYSARMISRYRPCKPLVAVTMNEATRRRCALYWGVQALVGYETDSLNNMLTQVDDTVTREGLAQRGDTVIIVAGTPLLIGGRTNMLKIHRIGEKNTKVGK
ncbi:MAG: pyruvate kinase [Candidatus Hydrogenedentota bacterium]